MSIGALIVDDQPDVRRLIRLIIEDANRELFVSGEAASGEEALAQVDELDPSVVLLDYMMPDMDGFQAAAKILARRPAQRMILCTAFLDEEVRHRALQSGFSACLSKGEFFRIPDAVRDVADRAV